MKQRILYGYILGQASDFAPSAPGVYVQGHKANCV